MAELNIKRYALLLVPIFLLSLSGCRNKLNLDDVTGVEESCTQAQYRELPEALQEVHPIPKENRSSVNPLSRCAANENGDGYYTGTCSLRYYDVKTDTSFYLCDQPGCSHQDETCRAWMGGYMSSIVAYHGKVYAIVHETAEPDSNAKLVAKEVESGNLEILSEWNQGEDGIIRVPSIVRTSDDLMLVSVQKSSLFGNMEQEDSVEYLCYDLRSGEKTEILADENVSNLPVLGLSRDYFVCYYSDLDAFYNFPSREDYSGGTFSLEEYMKQRNIAAQMELRRYDMKTGEYEVICSAEEDNCEFFYTHSNTYDNLTIYNCGDTVWLYDMVKNEKREFLTAPEQLINRWIVDGKVLILTNSGDGVRVYISDLEKPEWFPIDNRESQAILFYPETELNDLLIGKYNGGTYLISKQDFYLGNFETAVPSKT